MTIRRFVRRRRRHRLIAAVLRRQGVPLHRRGSVGRQRRRAGVEIGGDELKEGRISMLPLPGLGEVGARRLHGGDWRVGADEGASHMDLLPC